jgi:hypothetical protein
MDKNIPNKTNEEIKKALVFCPKLVRKEGCVLEGCPYFLSENCTEVFTTDAINLINDLEEKNERLLQIAKKMHTWIFLHSFDEEEAYKEIGLTEEENFILGYLGKVEIASEEIDKN